MPAEAPRPIANQGQIGAAGNRPNRTLVNTFQPTILSLCQQHNITLNADQLSLVTLFAHFASGGTAPAQAQNALPLYAARDVDGWAPALADTPNGPRRGKPRSRQPHHWRSGGREPRRQRPSLSQAEDSQEVSTKRRESVGLPKRRGRRRS